MALSNEELEEILVTIRNRKFSRREQRRSRKAAKNAHMWRTKGRRPWDYVPGGEVLDGCMAVYSVYGDNPHYLSFRLKRLKEPSGFVAMSRLAEEMRLTKAHTPDFVDEAVTYTEEQLKAIETWIRETWGDLKPAETAEKLGRGGR